MQPHMAMAIKRRPQIKSAISENVTAKSLVATRAASSVLSTLLLLATAGVANAAPATIASKQIAPLLAPLDEFVAAFNRWDSSFPAEAFTNDCVVMDIFPPFVWQGPGAPRRWWAVLSGVDAASHVRKAGLHQQLQHGQVEALSEGADEAQFNVPATLTYSMNGRTHTIHGRWIITERLMKNGWRISAHAWATLDQQ